MQLAPKAVAVDILRGAIVWAILLIVAVSLVFGIPALQTPIVLAVLALAVIVLIIELAWLTPAAVRSFRYSVSPDGVHTSAGVIFRRENFVPMQQILIVERRQGPIMRSFGLVKVRFRVPGSFIDIDGVTDDAFAALQREVRSAHARDDHG